MSNTHHEGMKEHRNERDWKQPKPEKTHEEMQGMGRDAKNTQRQKKKVREGTQIEKHYNKNKEREGKKNRQSQPDKTEDECTRNIHKQERAENSTSKHRATHTEQPQG